MDNLLSLREREIFETLKELDQQFIVIGGYAVNAYTLPRFSVDCDIVVKDMSVAEKIGQILEQLGYGKAEASSEMPYHGDFVRYEKEIKKNFKVSLDILVSEVFDRQSGARFSFEWIFEHSGRREMRGKTITESLPALIPEAEALMTMKFASCRETDIRDMFMMVRQIRDLGGLRKMITNFGVNFGENFIKVKKLVTSEEFRNNLQGVYGYLDKRVFEKHRDLLLSLERV